MNNLLSPLNDSRVTSTLIVTLGICYCFTVFSVTKDDRDFELKYKEASISLKSVPQ